MLSAVSPDIIWWTALHSSCNNPKRMGQKIFKTVLNLPEDKSVLCAGSRNLTEWRHFGVVSPFFCPLSVLYRPEKYRKNVNFPKLKFMFILQQICYSFLKILSHLF